VKGGIRCGGAFFVFLCWGVWKDEWIRDGLSGGLPGKNRKTLLSCVVIDALQNAKTGAVKKRGKGFLFQAWFLARFFVECGVRFDNRGWEFHGLWHGGPMYLRRGSCWAVQIHDPLTPDNRSG